MMYLGLFITGEKLITASSMSHSRLYIGSCSCTGLTVNIALLVGTHRMYN